MRTCTGPAYLLSASAALLCSALLSAGAAASENDYERLLREWLKRTKNTGKVKKLIREARKKREKEKKKRHKEASKLSLQMVKEAFEKGKKAYEDKRYSEAYLYFADVVQSRHSGALSMVNQARTWLAEIEAQSRARVEQARILLLQHRPADAAVTLQYVVASFPYCEATDDARSLLRVLKSFPSVAAAVRFSEGKAHETAGNYVEAFRTYEEIVQRWPHELGAEEARRAMLDLRADPEKSVAIRDAKDEQTATECRKRLLRAQNFLANDMPELASPELQWIIRNAPGTSASAEAEQLMFQLEAASSTDSDAGRGVQTAEDDTDEAGP